MIMIRPQCWEDELWADGVVMLRQEPFGEERLTGIIHKPLRKGARLVEPETRKLHF